MKWEHVIVGFGIFLVIGKYALDVASVQVEMLMKTILTTILIVVIFALLAFLVLATNRIRFRIQVYQAEALQATRDAEVMTVVAAPNEQVFIRDKNEDAIWHNTALEARSQFGHNIPEAETVHRQQWILLQQVRLLSHKTGQAIKENIAEELPALLEGPMGIPKRVDIEPMLAQRKPSLGNLILGVTEGGQTVRADARQLFHILIAGSTRWGKSIFLQMFLYQLLQIDNVQVYLADLEENTFVDFGLPFAGDREAIENLLKTLWGECKQRKELFTADPARSYRTLEQYNGDHPDKPLPYVFCFLDEINGLLDKHSPDHSPETITYLNTLGKRVARYGVYLIAAGQDLRANVMPSGIKNQFISLFQFKAMQRTQARNLIEDSDAHKIKIKGRAYAQINELGETVELQVPFIEQDTILALRDRLDVEKVAPYIISEPGEPGQVNVDIKPTDAQAHAFKLYEEGKSLRSITGYLYEKFGLFYNKRFWKLCLKYDIPLRPEDAEKIGIEN